MYGHTIRSESVGVGVCTCVCLPIAYRDMRYTYLVPGLNMASFTVHTQPHNQGLMYLYRQVDATNHEHDMTDLTITYEYIQ